MEITEPASLPEPAPSSDPVGAGAEPRASGDRPGRPGAAVTAVSVAVGAVFAVPLIRLALDAAAAPQATLATWASAAALAPLARSLALATSVAVTASALGTALAWIVGRTDVPWPRLWRLLLPLPLVVPSFIGAFALIAAVAPGGMVDRLLPWVEVGTRLRGFGGAFVVLTLFTYPYVLLPVLARLGRLPASHEESARLLGARPWTAFRTVVWPQTRSAVRAGGLLVFLYAISDFGAVQLLRYDTFTRVIYASRIGQPEVATALGLGLALLAVAVVAVERRAASDLASARVATGARPLQVRLGRWRPLALAAVAGTVLLALLGPIATLVWWASRGVARDGLAGLLTQLGDLGEPIVATVAVGLAGAAVAVAVTLPVAVLTTRSRGPAAALVNAVVVGGFALPGLVIALALVSLTSGGVLLTAARSAPLVVLITGYVVHFGSQALRTGQIAVAGVPARMGEAARTLGAGRWRRLATVELPLMAPGLAAGGGLVLLSVMKELPATLLLSPPGFRTLATRVWSAAESAYWAEAAVASLVLVAVSGVLTWVLVVRRAGVVEQ